MHSHYLLLYLVIVLRLHHKLGLDEATIVSCWTPRQPKSNGLCCCTLFTSKSLRDLRRMTKFFNCSIIPKCHHLNHYLSVVIIIDRCIASCLRTFWWTVMKIMALLPIFKIKDIFQLSIINEILNKVSFKIKVRTTKPKSYRYSINILHCLYYPFFPFLSFVFSVNEFLLTWNPFLFFLINFILL